MNNENDNYKNLVLIQNLLTNQDYKNLISRFRKFPNFPREGFANHVEFGKWESKYLYRDKYINDFDSRLGSYAADIITKFSFMCKPQFKSLIKSSLIYKKPSINLRQKIQLDECLLFHVTDKRKFRNGDGIYIKISPYSTITDIKKFITDNKNNIAKIQDEYKKKVGGKEVDRNRPSLYPERDKLIYDLWQCTIEDLSLITESKSKSKDIQIEHAMKLTGFTVSSDHVRKIVQTQKEKKNL